jgi:hypothetical protein
MRYIGPRLEPLREDTAPRRLRMSLETFLCDLFLRPRISATCEQILTNIREGLSSPEVRRLIDERPSLSAETRQLSRPKRLT